LGREEKGRGGNKRRGEERIFSTDVQIAVRSQMSCEATWPASDTHKGVLCMDVHTPGHTHTHTHTQHTHTHTHIHILILC
jgi:hypothetical protein